MSVFQIDAGKEWRGGQRQSFFLARELQRKTYAFQFCVQPHSPLYEKAMQAHLPVVSLKMRNEMDVMAILQLARTMKRHNCQLAHFHDAHATTVGSAAASLAKVPLRVISRRVDFPLKNHYFSRLKYRKNIDLIIAISEGVKKVLIEGGVRPEVIKVIPSGIDYSLFKEAGSCDYLRNERSFKEEDFLVGVVAHLADHKGHRYLIEATRILKEKAPSIKVIIVGEGPLRMELSNLVKDIHVEDMVFFLGFREDIPQILASLDLFVLSSKMEGLGSSILDAMASSLPVVATNVGGIPEVVTDGETGLLVPPKDPSVLAEAILRLYNDRELAKRLGQRGYEVAHQKFSAEVMALKIIREYECLAKRKGIRLF